MHLFSIREICVYKFERIHQILSRKTDIEIALYHRPKKYFITNDQKSNRISSTIYTVLPKPKEV